MTDRPDPVVLRAALQIHASLRARWDCPAPIILPEQSWIECGQVQRRLQIACSRGWAGAAGRLRERLQATLLNLQSALERQSQSLAEAPPSIASVPEILRDLAALTAEFDGVELDLRRAAVRVTTEPIVLESTQLGPFEIRLEWSRRGGPPWYTVVALDPRRSTFNDSVTHPHVDGDQLCEGAGRTPIREALQSGRLLDFFFIVQQILRTYNRSSAYVALNEWDGRPCHGCGASVPEDDADRCHECDALVCGNCCCACSNCREDFCDRCVALCGGCEQPLCCACLNRCLACEGDRCEDCLDEHGRCAACPPGDRETDDAGTGPLESAKPRPITATAAPAV